MLWGLVGIKFLREGIVYRTCTGNYWWNLDYRSHQDLASRDLECIAPLHGVGVLDLRYLGGTAATPGQDAERLVTWDDFVIPSKAYSDPLSSHHRSSWT